MKLNLLSVTVLVGTASKFQLESLTFQIQEGEILAVVGESGSGKTSLLNAISGFFPITKGEIRLGDSVLSSKSGIVSPEKRSVAYIFQDHNLIEHLSLQENLLMGFSQAKRQEKKEAINRIVKDLELEQLLHKYPHEVSGGQQQRIALARSLLHEKKVLLFDEAFTGLDKQNVYKLAGTIRAFIKKYHRIAIFVTHQIDEAFLVADTIAIMKQGKFLQHDTIYTLFQKPVNAYVAGFMGPVNFLSGVRRSNHIETEFGIIDIDKNITYPKADGTKCIVLTRPDDYQLIKSQASDMYIQTVQFLGMQQLVTVVHNKKHIMVLTEHEFDCRVGDMVEVKLRHSHPYLVYTQQGKLLS